MRYVILLYSSKSLFKQVFVISFRFHIQFNIKCSIYNLVYESFSKQITNRDILDSLVIFDNFVIRDTILCNINLPISPIVFYNFNIFSCSPGYCAIIINSGFLYILNVSSLSVWGLKTGKFRDKKIEKFGKSLILLSTDLKSRSSFFLPIFNPDPVPIGIDPFPSRIFIFPLPMIPVSMILDSPKILIIIIFPIKIFFSQTIFSSVSIILILSFFPEVSIP